MQKTISNTYTHEINSKVIKLCHKLELPLHFNKKGPKIFTNYQRIALIVLFLRSKKNLRDFIKELYETLWPKWLSLREIPGKSTLHDWLNLFKLRIIRLLNEFLLEEEKPEIMAIDATGLDSWQRSRHYERRMKQCGIREEYMPYAKADILIDTKTLLVHDWILRIKPRHDVLGALSILNRIKTRDSLILGDKGYDSERVHEKTHQKGNDFYAPVRNTSRKKPKGYYRRKCYLGNENYPKRMTVESTIHALKSMKRELRSKLQYMKKREFGWQILTYNIKRIIQRINSLITRLSTTYSGHSWKTRMCPKS